MAYKVIILYQLYMPSYFLGTFTEYPYITAYFSIFHRIVNEYWLILTNCSFSPLSE